MQDLEFKKQLASLYAEVRNFESQYLGTYLNSVGENPHIIRLLESFTFLHTKLHYALDKAHSDLISSLIELVVPHINRPIPSVIFTHFIPSKDQELPIVIPKGALIQMQHKGQKATFHVCYETLILPILIQQVSCYNITEDPQLPKSTQSCVAIKLQTIKKQKFDSLRLSKLRFFLRPIKQLEYSVYENIFTSLTGIRISDLKDSSKNFVLSPSSIKDVGFHNEENLLPDQSNTFTGYRLLTEFFFSWF